MSYYAIQLNATEASDVLFALCEGIDALEWMLHTATEESNAAAIRRCLRLRQKFIREGVKRPDGKEVDPDWASSLTAVGDAE